MGLVRRTHVQVVQDDGGAGGDAAPRTQGGRGAGRTSRRGVRVVHVVTDDKSAAGGQSCGVLSTSVKGARCH